MPTPEARAIADRSIDERVCCRDKYPPCQTEAWRIALAEEIDRFAAQRGAETMLNYAQRLEATLPIANTTLTVDAAMRGIIKELRGMAEPELCSKLRFLAAMRRAPVRCL